MMIPLMRLPALHDAASAMADRAQREFLWATRIQLAMLLVAAVGGVVTLEVGAKDTAVGAVVGLVAFIIAALARVYTLSRRPETRWYEGRAAAESVKTLAWRYAVGGQPFAVAQGTDPDRLFVERIREVLTSLSHLEAGLGNEAQITAEMKELRAASLSERKRAYEADRIRDQQRWYGSKAELNRKRALVWGLAVLGFQLAGAVSAIARIVQWIAVSLLGIAAAASAAAAAWLQSRQHESLVTAYSVASQELAGVRGLIGEGDDEESWAAFVEDAEEAISREHTMWRASRGLRHRRF
jgi:SMODS and SLOG-associating 2TM effector domain 3/SMODS and SLOG-associating 2TM effector domain 1